MAALNVTLQKPTVLQQSEEEKQLVQGFKQESEALPAKVAPIQAERGKLEGEMQALAQPGQPPKLEQTPVFQPREVDRGEMMTFGTVATVLASLATRAVRGDISLALNAAGSAINGFHEGRIEQARLDIQNFNTKMKSVLERNNTMMSEYKAVMEDRKLTLAQKMAQYNVLGAKFNDEITLAAARRNDLKFLIDLEEKRRGANQQAEFMYTRLQSMLDVQAARVQAMVEMRNARDSQAGIGDGTALTPQAIELLARESLKSPQVLVGLGRGIQGARDLRAVRNKQAEILAAEGGSGMAQRAAEFRADSNSLNKMTMSYDAITAFEKTAVRNGRMLVDLGNKVDVTGMPVAERWIRGGRVALAGDPDVSVFNAQMQVYRTEAAKILTNPNLTGQLTDSARKEVEHFLAGDDSAASITRVVALLERDFDNRKITLEEQMDAARDRMTRGYGAGTKPGAAPKEGERSKSKSGRPIIFRNGNWEYEG